MMHKKRWGLFCAPINKNFFFFFFLLYMSDGEEETGIRRKRVVKKREKLPPTEAELRAEENRKKIIEQFEGLVKFQTKKEVSKEDEDFVTYRRVEVYQTFTKDGPSPGQKFLRVDVNPSSGDVFFRLKNGGSRVVVLSSKPGKAPVYGGEFKPPEDVEDEVDSDGEVFIPEGRRARI
jgi:hypothetical protein